MNSTLPILALVPALCLVSCERDLNTRESLAAETHAFLSATFGEELQADATYIAACYDNPDNVSLMPRLIAIPLVGVIPGEIDHAKARALLSAWIRRGIELRDPLSMLICVELNGNPTFGVSNASPEDAGRMAQEAFTLLRDKPNKTSEQWQALLMCYVLGEGTEADMTKARELYATLEEEIAAGRLQPLSLTPELVEELNKQESEPTP